MAAVCNHRSVGSYTGRESRSQDENHEMKCCQRLYTRLKSDLRSFTENFFDYTEPSTQIWIVLQSFRI